MAAQQRSVNMDFLFKAYRPPRIEFWRKNDDGTCTRLADGLTLSTEDYDRLPVDAPPHRTH